MAISFRLAWQSLVHGADAPPDSWKEDGVAPGRLPNLLVNWLLVGLTEVVDSYLANLSKAYVHTRWITHGLPRGIFVLRQTSAPWGVVWQQVDLGSDGPNQQAAEDSGVVVYYLDSLPRGCRILEVKAIIKPATGHTGLPSTMPKMRIVVYRRSDFAEMINPVESDASADVTAYEALHTIDSADPELGDYDPAEFRFVVQVFGEAGTGGTTFKRGLQVYGVEVRYRLALADLVQSATEYVP